MDKYVVAVSGGVDSVVLLDMLSKKPNMELIVAHFDHGIRPDSKLDADFVAGLAKQYGLIFETRREELGGHASENLARKRRYGFLRQVAKKYDAKIATAHHADDVIETIAINLHRGTGWRGLAAMDSSDVTRPLTDMTKSEIIDYAKKNGLVWREDSTNISDKYLRNRIRQKTIRLDDDTKRQLLGLWMQQKRIRWEIDGLIKEMIPKNSNYERKMFDDMDEKVAIEVLRYITGAKLTRPQLAGVLNAIKTYLPSKIHYPGGDIRIDFTSRIFTVKLLK